MRSVAGLIIFAALLWTIMFAPPAPGKVPFWPSMVISTGILAGSFFGVERRNWRARFRFEPRHVWIGLGAAALLYLGFWVGNLISREVLASAGREIGAIHTRKEGANLLWVGLALVFWIGPAEEIFWRGLVQHRLMNRVGPLPGVLLSAGIYAAVHAGSLNLMLVLAALVCGLFWGFLYLWTRSLWPVFISHALWDLVIFVLRPVG